MRKNKKILNDDELEPEDLEHLEEGLEEDLFAEKKPRRRKEKGTTEEYVNKDEMWNELRDYYIKLGEYYDWEKQKITDKTKKFPEISKELARMIDDIATKMGYRSNFLNYSYLDEMRGDGKLKMFKAVRDGSFKCYSTVEVIERRQENDQTVIYYYDKKGKIKKKPLESTDVFKYENGKEIMTFKANAFGYFCRINTHSFLNRIKKEKEIDETKKNYQEQTWERIITTDLWANVKRPKYIDADENDMSYDSE